MKTLTSDPSKKLVEIEERVVPAVLSAVVIRLVNLGCYLGITDRTGDATIDFGVDQSRYGYQGREFARSISFRVSEDGSSEVILDGSVMTGITLSHKDFARAELLANQIVSQIPGLPNEVGFVAQEKSRSRRRTTDRDDRPKP